MSNYEKYTVKELKNLCRDIGVKGYSKLLKTGIIDLLKGFQLLKSLNYINIHYSTNLFYI